MVELTEMPAEEQMEMAALVQEAACVDMAVELHREEHLHKHREEEPVRNHRIDHMHPGWEVCNTLAVVAVARVAVVA